MSHTSMPKRSSAVRLPAHIFEKSAPMEKPNVMITVISCHVKASFFAPFYKISVTA